MITLHTKDLYVNLHIQNILHINEFWLNKHNQDKTMTGQILHLTEVIIKQNYFQYNNQFFQQNKGITMGSPISCTLAKTYLRFLEEMYIKHWLGGK